MSILVVRRAGVAGLVAGVMVLTSAAARAQEAPAWPADEVIRDTLRGWGLQFTLEDGRWVSDQDDGRVVVRLEGPGPMPQRYVVVNHRNPDASATQIIAEAVGVPDDVMGTVLGEIGPWMQDFDPGEDCFHAVHEFPGGMVAADREQGPQRSMVVSFLPPGSRPTAGDPSCSTAAAALATILPEGTDIYGGGDWWGMKPEAKARWQAFRAELERQGTRFGQGFTGGWWTGDINVTAVLFPGVDPGPLVVPYADAIATQDAAVDTRTIGGREVRHAVGQERTNWTWAQDGVLWVAGSEADADDSAIETIMSGLRPLPSLEG